MIFLGKFLKSKNILSDNAIAGIKDLCVSVFLPAIAFDTLIHGTYSSDSIIFIVLEIIVLAVSFLIGFPLKRFFDKDLQGYVPYALPTYEGGLFGWALIAILVGQSNLFTIITMDMISAIFCFTILSTGLKLLSGVKMTRNQIIRSIATSPMIITVIIGSIGAAFNLGEIIDNSQFAGLYEKVSDFLIQPLNPLILLSIGAGLSFDWKVLSKALKLVIIRFSTQIILCAFVMFTISCTVGLTPVMKVSLPMYFMCPTSFLFAMYAKEKKAIEFTSGFLSMEIVITLVCFSALSIYAGYVL